MMVEDWRPIVEAPQTGELVDVVVKTPQRWRYYQAIYQDGQWLADETWMAGYPRLTPIQPDYWIVRHLPPL